MLRISDRSVDSESLNQNFIGNFSIFNFITSYV